MGAESWAGIRSDIFDAPPLLSFDWHLKLLPSGSVRTSPARLASHRLTRLDPAFLGRLGLALFGLLGPSNYLHGRRLSYRRRASSTHPSFYEFTRTIKSNPANHRHQSITCGPPHCHVWVGPSQNPLNSLARASNNTACHFSDCVQ